MCRLLRQSADFSIPKVVIRMRTSLAVVSQ